MRLITISTSMTMAIVNSNSALAAIVFCVYFIHLISAETDPSCPGPTAYYNAIGCKPVIENSAKCPKRYDCDFFKSRSVNKCYVNDNEYDIGEKLKDEDANPCDIGCTCRSGYSGIASFTCAVVDCFFAKSKPGCYRKNSPMNCCPGEEVCPENPEDRATCIVNGVTYKDGEHFTIPDDPDKNCVCQEGYVGENDEPFCVTPKRPYCSSTFRDAYSVYSNCPPVYYSNQSPQTSCNLSTRCQNNNDTVIHSTDDSSEETDPNMLCKFGNLTMHLDDELNQATDYSSVCVKCICEIPPVPTCQRLPDDECDVTKHPPFGDY